MQIFRNEFQCISMYAKIQGPRTPQGGCTGVLVSEMEGRGPFFPFARVVTYTPQ